MILLRGVDLQSHSWTGRVGVPGAMSSQHEMPAEGPDDPAYTGEDEEPREDEGQVSEVSGMDPADADTPIQPSDATAGSPDGESGEAQEGEAGPAAKPRYNEETNEYGKD